MKINLALAASVLMVSLATAGAPAEAKENGAASDQAKAWLADAKVLEAAMSKGQCEAGLPAARRIVASPPFETLTDDLKGTVWEFAADCAIKNKNWEEGFVDVREATALNQASDWAWIVRVELGVQLDRPDDVAETVETLVRVRPAALKTIGGATFAQFVNRQETSGRADAARRVLNVLEEVGYRSPEPGMRDDSLWANFARLLADSGEMDHARSLLERIGDSKVLLEVKLDGRFAAMVAADPTKFDIKASAERELVADQATMAAHQDLLALVVAVATDLRALERYDQALTLLQSALDRAAGAPKGKPAFSDQDEQLNWIQDAKSLDLLDLGRGDDALAVERQAASSEEQGDANVSQTINLAGLLESEGRPADALVDLKDFEQSRSASDYGAMWVRATRGCADAQLGRASDLATELGFVAEHRKDNPSARLRALICANDLDAAAAEFITQLTDPAERASALVNLSHFDPPNHPTPIDAAFRARLEQIAARPDVTAAVAKVGHVERVRLNGGAFTDLF